MSETNKSRHPTLVIFCKRPLIYQGKQRLAATIGAESAFSIAQLLLDCALEDANSWQGPVVLTISHKEDAIWASALLNRPHSIIVQNTGNLGQRINSVDKQLRILGHQQLVFIGTDAPMLTAAHYQQVIQNLSEADIVLSNADDGGVVIMANSQPWPDIKALPWSTSTLGLELAKTCSNYRLSVQHIATGYDIDVEQDLLKLKESLFADKRPARQSLLSKVEKIGQADSMSNYA